MKPLSNKLFEAQQEAWYRGNLSFKLHAGQKVIKKAVDQLEGQLAVLNCSRQWGKTTLMVIRAIETAIKKKCKVKIGTAFLTDLTEFILPKFDEILQDCPQQIKPKYKVQGSKFVFPNGSEIKLCGLDKNPNSLRGGSKENALIVLDEAGFIDGLDKLYSNVLIPMTTHNPNCKIIMISTPPNSPAHPFVDFAQRAETEKCYYKFTVYDNPLIDEATINRLAKEVGGFESTSWKREYLCEFLTDEDLALVREWNDDFVSEPPRDEYYRFYHKYTAMDMGRKDHTALVFGYYDFKRATFFIEDELIMKGSEWTTVTLKAAILAKEKQLWGDEKPFRRVADNNNPHLIQDLNSLHNVHFMETSKESLEAMVNEVRIMVGNGQLHINPECPMTIGCFKYGVWDKNRKEFARSKVYGHFDHFAASMYLIRNIAKHTNPIPLDYGHESYKGWKKNLNGRHSKSHNANVIANALMPKRPKPY